MKTIKVYGMNCPKCAQLYEHIEKAAVELGIKYTIEKITDIDKIIETGIALTPAVSVDGVVKVSGKVPSVEALKKIL